MPVGRLKHLPLQKEWTLVLIIIVLIVAAAGAGGYYFSQHHNTFTLLKNTQTSPSNDVADTVAKVSKLMLLPNETPTLATVSDKSKLADKPFFAHAENGDKVLIYANAKKAILYRPSINKIIEVAPVELPVPSPTVNQVNPSPSASPSAVVSQAKVVIWNGTDTVGLTKQVEKVLNDKLPSVEVIDRTNAQMHDYAQTLVVPLDTSSKSAAEVIASAVGGKVADFPKNETKPTQGNILIIAGEDFGK